MGVCINSYLRFTLTHSLIPSPLHHTAVTQDLQKLQKSLTPEASPLGPLANRQRDLLDEALAVTNEATSSVTFTPKQLEDLFWALYYVAGIKYQQASVARIGEQFIVA